MAYACQHTVDHARTETGRIIATRISVATSTNEKRKFIGQFTDDSSLSYFNARYYDSSRGEFLSEDPVFLTLAHVSLIGAMWAWGYSGSWGYGPGGIVGVLLIVVVVLALSGRI
jgi:RHS repeat-associated protein